MERRRGRESRESRTLRAMYPAYPQLGDDHDPDADATRVVTPVPRLARRSRPRPTDRLPALALPKTETDQPPQRTLILPAQQQHQRRQQTLARLPVPTPALAAPQPRRSPVSRVSRLSTFGAVLVALVVALCLHVVQATHQPPSTTTTASVASVPAPSGRGPWSASSGALVVISAVAPVTRGTSNISDALQPCHDATLFLPTITQWSVPPGCYGNIYQPNPANYVQRPGFGWCNWWVRVTHPAHPDITESLAYPRGTNPVAGAPIFFDGNEQGADSEGHWAVAVAVSPDHYWVLISEMNFAWRGGGWGKLDYRYIHVSPHVHFVYIFS